MNDYIGTIKLFAGSYAPSGWLICDGSLIKIIESTEGLFSVIGTMYGGDGKEVFALPDLRARVPVGAKTGTGTIPLATVGGEVSVTLTKDQTGHRHNLMVSSQKGTKFVPGPGSSIGAPNQGVNNYELFASAAPNVPLNSGTLSFSGGDQPHNNMQPYLGVNYIICYVGEMPS